MRGSFDGGSGAGVIGDLAAGATVNSMIAAASLLPSRAKRCNPIRSTGANQLEWAARSAVRVTAFWPSLYCSAAGLSTCWRKREYVAGKRLAWKFVSPNPLHVGAMAEIPGWVMLLLKKKLKPRRGGKFSPATGCQRAVKRYFPGPSGIWSPPRGPLYGNTA